MVVVARVQKKGSSSSRSGGAKFKAPVQVKEKIDTAISHRNTRLVVALAGWLVSWRHPLCNCISVKKRIHTLMHLDMYPQRQAIRIAAAKSEKVNYPLPNKVKKIVELSNFKLLTYFVFCLFVYLFNVCLE